MQEKHERGDGKQGKSAGKETGGMTAKRRPKARLCLVYLRLSVRPFVRLSVSVSLLPDFNAVSRIRYDTYSNCLVRRQPARGRRLRCDPTYEIDRDVLAERLRSRATRGVLTAHELNWS